MSLFEAAMDEMKAQVLNELEERLWARLEPRITESLLGRHLSVAETAQYLHVSEATVRRMIQEKTIPHFRVRNQLFTRQTDVDAWVERQIKVRKGG